MNNPLQVLVQMGVVPTVTFPTDSRYYNNGTPLSMELPDGRTVNYLNRRFIPPASTFTPYTQHQVKQGERPDQLAAAYFGDPLLFWRLCDANGALFPEEITSNPGRVLNITFQAGSSGVDHG